jgi:hypothetical protein
MIGIHETDSCRPADKVRPPSIFSRPTMATSELVPAIETDAWRLFDEESRGDRAAVSLRLRRPGASMRQQHYLSKGSRGG